MTFCAILLYPCHHFEGQSEISRVGLSDLVINLSEIVSCMQVNIDLSDLQAKEKHFVQPYLICAIEVSNWIG